jgi:lysine 2,3-aminomutase
MPVVYIKENKSIAEYLGQLVEMGEKLADYNSLWLYSAGQTEPRFGLYEYDNSVKGLTTEFSNIAQEIVTDERSNIPHAS